MSNNNFRMSGQNAPYYDDFDPSKNYKRILFNPAVAIQARELTQSQTALQYQMASFGSYMFTDGQPISGAKITYTYKQPVMRYNVLDINGTSVNPETLVGLKFIGQSSGQMILVTGFIPSTRYITFSYMGSNLTSGEDFQSYTSPTVYFTMEAGSISNCLSASCTEGTVFIDGYFVDVPASTVIVSATPNMDWTYNIGYKVERNIVSSAQDATLNDPAAGTFNYNAPGAERFQIKLSLMGYASEDTSITTETTENFVSGIVVKNDVLLKDQNYDVSGKLMDTLAQRTYDESGSYSVSPWNITIEENTSDLTKYNAVVQPGAGYIQGYRVQNLVSNKLSVDKPRESLNKGTTNTYVSSGVYTYGLFDDVTQGLSARSLPTFTKMETVEVMTGTNGTGTVIGECNVVSMSRIGTKLYIYMTNVSPVINGFPGARSIRSKANPTTAYINLWVNSFGYAELNGQDGPQIVQTPFTMVKSIVSNSLQYTMVKRYSVTSEATGNTINLSEPDYTIDLPNTTGLLTIFNAATGAHINTSVLSMVPNNNGSVSTAVITGPTIANNTQYLVSLQVMRNNLSPRQKIANIVTKTVTIDADVDLLNLTEEDVFSIVSVTQTSNLKTGADANITQYLSLNDGQTDYTYEAGSISGWNSAGALAAKASTVTATTYTLKYAYYMHSGTGPFTADSYISTNNSNILTNIPDLYSAIPKYRSSANIVYNLRDCIDFRVKRSELTSSSHQFPCSMTNVEYSADIYLPRWDLIWVNKNGTFGITQGISSENPAVPNTIEGTMNLAILKNSPYVIDKSNITIVKNNTQRYTMSDIAAISTRLDRAENAIALTALEQSALNTQLTDSSGNSLYKSGIFTDNFSSFANSDFTNELWNCTLDSEENCLRPQFTAENYSFEFSPSTSTVQKNGILLNMPYTTSVYAKNMFASDTVNVQQYMFYSWKGDLTLTPSVDTWVNDLGNIPIKETYIETPRPPSRYRIWYSIFNGSRVDASFSNWSAAHNQVGYQVYIKENVVDKGYTIADEIVSSNVSIDEYMRKIDVSYSLTNMRPGVNLTAFMDTVQLTLSNSLVASDGTCTGTFTVPDNMPVGQKLVKFYDSEQFALAQASYTANGTTIWNNVNRTYIRTWEYVANVNDIKYVPIDPVAESIYIEEDNGVYIDSIDVYFATKDASLGVGMYIVECENGTPTTTKVPLTDVVLESADVNIGLNTATKFKFKQPVYLYGKTEYAFIVWSTSYQYTLYKSTLGQVDLNTGVGIAEQPFLGSMFLSQNTRTWTPEQMSDLKFAMHKCVFQTNTNYVAKFNLEIPTSDFDVAYQCLVTNDYVPSGTSLKYSYRWYNDSTFTQYNNREEVFLPLLKTISSSSGTTSLEIMATFSTTDENLSPQLDLEQIYGIFTNNTCTSRVGDTAYLYNCGTYISNAVTMTNSASDLRVILNVLRPSGSDIDVYFKTTPYYPMYVTHSVASGGLCVDPAGAKNNIGKTVQLFYYNNVTKQLEPKSQCIITGYNNSTNHRVYLRSVGNPSDFVAVNPIDPTDTTYTGISTDYTALILLDVYSTTNINCPAWSAKTFASGSFVTYNGYIWKANIATVNSNTPSDISSVWTKVDGIKVISSLANETDVVEWRPMSKDTTAASAVNNGTNYVENTYYPSITLESEFTQFAIRIDMKSQNKVDVPKVKNLRAIAVI